MPFTREFPTCQRQGVNSINILHSAFTLIDPESVKILLSHQHLFMLLASEGIKAVRRMLMKSNQGVNSINLQCKAVKVNKRKIRKLFIVYVLHFNYQK